MLLQQVVFHGFDVVEVIVAIGQFGRVNTVHEVVVGGDGVRAQAAGKQLHAESLAERGLTR